MSTVIIFIVALSILVFVHEWGHFIVAKLSGVRVDVFSIGFGPKILGFTWHGTEYRLAPIPFGGYVRIYGQEPLEEAEGDLEKAEEIANDPTSFSSKPLFKKIAVVLAGPAMNLVLCFAIMPLVFMIGRLQPKFLEQKPVLVDVIKESPAAVAKFQTGDLILALNGKETKNWKEVITQVSLYPDAEVSVDYERNGVKQQQIVQLTTNKELSQPIGYLGIDPREFRSPLVGGVSPGLPAEKVGLLKGDIVKSINNVPVKYWRDITENIKKSNGASLNVVVSREGQDKAFNLVPDKSEQNDRWIIGISQEFNKSEFIKKKFGIADSIVLGSQECFKLFGLTFDILGRLFTGNLSVKTLGGPLQIAKATSNAARSGMGEFIFLLAFLSMQLGIMNLLPIPVLDGGHLVFMTVEGIRRKPLSPRFRAVAMQAGLVMLLGLMLFVTINDVNSIWGFSNILESVKSIF
ncbi:RIP metalloprotease RseP [bacterium K02(2017)]|nr:RIP metalloprotease RseP [bacterium K02(2017)]